MFLIGFSRNSDTILKKFNHTLPHYWIKMYRLLKTFIFFALCAFASEALLYKALLIILSDGIEYHSHVFGGLYRMFMYHAEYPYQYIALIAVVYAIVATFYVLVFPNLSGWRRQCSIVGIMLTTILVASAPGGILWKIHDMQAGHYTQGLRFWNDLIEGASMGLQLGWLIITISVPYNIFSLIIGYWGTSYGLKFWSSEAIKSNNKKSPLN